jgi:uncharacterized membrane protein YoaK (UPF0700 family)
MTLVATKGAGVAFQKFDQRIDGSLQVIFVAQRWAKNSRLMWDITVATSKEGEEAMQHSETHPSDLAGRPQGTAPPLAREQSWAAFLLAWVAAFSDAIGFLVLQQLGASFMSGNSLAMGVALGQLDWTSVLQRGLPILVFFLGNMLGFLVLTQVGRWGIRSPFAIVFGLEAVCLLAFLQLGTHALQGGIIRPFPAGTFSLCVVLLTLSMGLQTTTVRGAGGQSVRTTFVTGVLSDWAHALTQYLSWLHQQSTEREVRQVVRESMRQASFRRLLLLGGIWGCYVVSAICGSALELHMALFALVFPLCVLVVFIIIDMFRPFEA